jgi:hypothetical protein
MNIMKQEGIRTKCVVKWVHNVEFMSVRQHTNVLSVIATRSCKNAPLSLPCLSAFDNSETVKHTFMKFHVASSYWNMWTFQFLLKSNSNNGHFTRACRCVLGRRRDCAGNPRVGNPQLFV